MDANLAGFVALGALTLGLFASLRQDIRALCSELGGEIDALRNEMRGEIDTLRNEIRGEINGLRGEINELRDRVARIEGLLEAVFMRRDLTPLPEPPSGNPSSKAA